MSDDLFALCLAVKARHVNFLIMAKEQGYSKGNLHKVSGALLKSSKEWNKKRS